MGRLNRLQIAQLKTRCLHGDGDGLYLRITASGSKSWIFRYRIDGRLRDHGLGPLAELGLAEAREKARECRRLRRDGLDPIEEKRKLRAAVRLDAACTVTFRACAEAYVEAQRPGWKNPKHAGQWTSTLATYVYPAFGDLPVADIDASLVVKALDPIWRGKTETATRVRGRIEAVLDWATVRGFREGDNPARWRGNLSHLLASPARLTKERHLPALPFAEMSAFWTELASVGGVAAMALCFTVLTAARSGETRGATWDEIDLANRVWSVPAARMKAEKEHRVPLSPQALAVLEKAARLGTTGLVFPGQRKGRPLSEMSLTKVLRDMGKADITVHGFRSSFRDWAAERTDIPREVAELCLAHTLKGKAEAAYWRSDLLDKRRPLMEAWATYCLGGTNGA